MMATKDRAAFRAARQWAHLRIQIGSELRDARRTAGLSQERVATSAGISQSQLSRIECGQSSHVATEVVGRVAAVVGLRLSMKLYPDGPPIRDAGQLADLATLRGRAHPSFTWRYEMPVTHDPDDRRTWDAELSRPGVLLHMEVEVNLVDMQALERRMSLKKRDGVPASLILVVRASRHNRQVLREAGQSLLEAFPLRTRATLAALTRGEDPGAATILL
jgi:transcriptional regulator with XRE-family HTH domain